MGDEIRIRSDATLRRLRPRLKEYSVPDLKVEGLNVRVRPSGYMSWVFRYQVGKKEHRITLGQYDRATPEAGMTLEQARREAERYRGWLANGHDPKQQLKAEERARSAAKTFGDAFRSYDEVHLSKLLSAEQTRAIYRRDIEPLIGGIPLQELHLDDLNAVYQAKKDAEGRRLRGAITACFQVVNRVLDHALAMNMLDVHPAPRMRLKDAGGASSITKRNLPFEELRTLLVGLESWGTDVRNLRLIRFLLGSGQRISAVLEMRWCELDLEGGVWHIPPSSVDRHSKSTEARRLPLSGYLLRQLKQQRKDIPKGWKLVWPQLGGDHQQQASAVRSLLKRNRPQELEPFSPHDLRRTFISRCNELSLEPIAIEKVVGHQLAGMLKVYNHHDYFEEQRTVLEVWGDKLDELAAPNVLQIFQRDKGECAG